MTVEEKQIERLRLERDRARDAHDRLMELWENRDKPRCAAIGCEEYGMNDIVDVLDVTEVEVHVVL